MTDILAEHYRLMNKNSNKQPREAEEEIAIFLSGRPMKIFF